MPPRNGCFYSITFFQHSFLTSQAKNEDFFKIGFSKKSHGRKIFFVIHFFKASEEMNFLLVERKKLQKNILESMKFVKKAIFTKFTKI